MPLIALKLTLAPLLILAASLAGRRWGERVSGWLVGLPLTSGPVSAFLTWEFGPQFASDAALGSIAGVIAQACFCVGYSALSGSGWPFALLVGTLAFATSGLALQLAGLGAILLVCLAFASLAIALNTIPASGQRREVATPTAWDLPVRMVIVAVLIVIVTAAAPYLGPRLSGTVATYPIFAVVLAVFAQMSGGAQASRDVLRGMLAGLFGFAIFFFALNGFLPRISPALAFLAAAGCAALAQGASFALLHRQPSEATREAG
jgi:hypothetical protein